MKLEVGMYVRTKKGIAKYLGVGKDVLKHTKKTNIITYNHYENEHIFDKYIFETNYGYGDTLNQFDFLNISKLLSKEPTFEIIDLIKVGDYVNGIEVGKVYNANDGYDGNKNYKFKEKTLELVNDIYETIPYEYLISNNEIERIVTKEQFESVSYKADLVEKSR